MKRQQNLDISHRDQWLKNLRAFRGINQNKIILQIQGFTLVELLVVCGVLAALITLAIPAFDTIRTKAKIARAKSEIRGLELTINSYNLENGHPPNGWGDFPNLNVKDPWGNNYVYYKKIAGDGDPGAYKDCSAAHDLNTDFDLYSKGADGDTSKNLADDPGASMDDIIRGHDGTTVETGLEYW